MPLAMATPSTSSHSPSPILPYPAHRRLRAAPLRRARRPAKDFVRGSMNIRPFRPGGLQDDTAEAAALEKAVPEGALNGDWVRELMSGGPTLTAPPGFRKGLELGQLKEYKSHWECFRDGDRVEEQPEPSSNDTMYSVQFDDLFKIAWEDDAVNNVSQEEDIQQLPGDRGISDIDKQKVDALQEASETPKLDTEKQEINNTLDVYEAQTDLDQMLSCEGQSTHRESSGLGDDKTI